MRKLWIEKFDYLFECLNLKKQLHWYYFQDHHCLIGRCQDYPILNNQAHASLLKHINAKDFPDQLNIEFLLDPTPKSGMKGCGMLILNPPYVLKGQMDEVSNFLQRLWRGKTDASA